VWKLIWEFLLLLAEEWKMAIIVLIILFLIGAVKPLKRFFGSIRDGIMELFTWSGITILVILSIITLIFLAEFGVI